MDDEKLIPELSVWRKHNGNDFSIEDWIVSEGNVRFAIAYNKIFWPEFVHYDNCVILKKIVLT